MSRIKATIFHNPRCSKSRKTLELLHQQALDITTIDYLNTPPDSAIITDILERLGCSPRQLIRSNESEYLEAGLDDPTLSDQTLIEAIVRYPRLLQRPIVLIGTGAAIGRPPEAVLELLQ